MNPNGFVRTTDGLDLAWRAWPAESPRGAIAIVHGLAEHGMRYAETGRALAEAGWSTYSLDLRGHGLSPDMPGSQRVHVDRFTDFLADVDALVNEVRQRHPEQPVFILGHSMGGLISLAYTLTHPQQITGAIISSPGLGVHPDSMPPALLEMMVGIVSTLLPRKLFPSDLDTKHVCRDPQVVADYENDPLVTDRVSARWYAEFIKAQEWVHEKAPQLERPVLLMQSGDDRLVDPEATARWATRAAAEYVEFVAWDGFYHEMLNEPGKEQVREKILAWLDSVLDVVDV